MAEVNYKIIGKNIRTARRTKGLRQHQLAGRIGIAEKYLCTIENGKSCSLNVLVTLANELNVGLDFLLGDNLRMTSVGNEKMLSQFQTLAPEFQNFITKNIEMLYEMKKEQD